MRAPLVARAVAVVAAFAHDDELRMFVKEQRSLDVKLPRRHLSFKLLANCKP